jgi:microcompartment protein CcmK/EutM
MNLCRVLGPVVATEKHAALAAKKLLAVQPLDENQVSAGKVFVAVDDEIGAGPGDLVLVLNEGSGARQILKDPTAAIRSLVVGIVDDVNA